jgi:small subunit ribosomal protein S7
MALVLSYLRAAPPPVVDPQRPLLPGAPPPQQLPLDPIRYLTLAIDSVAPLFRIHSLRGAAGGGQPLLTPVPLRERQRRRTAVMWILGAASKRPSRGGGKDEFARRVAEEIIAVVEGRSAAWEKRMALHKLSVSIRGNVADPRRGGRR